MPTAGPGELYNDTFYEDHVDGSIRSARVILGRLYSVYKPQSVVDFGCGRGAWLSVAGSLGSSVLRGLDGDWVGQDDLLDEKITFTPVDLSKGFSCGERFDLCMSLEVAEHLPPTRAEGFVRDMCSVSDVVLFSAATKGQPGTNHINTQWQSYWIELFSRREYDCFDIFRGATWNNGQVDWWYRQNTFLFVRRGATCIDRSLLLGMEERIYDLVHPKHYSFIREALDRLCTTPSLRFCLGSIKRYLTRTLSRKRRRNVSDTCHGSGAK